MCLSLIRVYLASLKIISRQNFFFFRFLYRDIPKHVEGRVITAPENNQSKIQEAA